MAQSVDPLQSFSYLVDHVPYWLSKLEELTVQCDEQYERFYRITKQGQVKLTRKKTTDSMESLRPKRERSSQGTEPSASVPREGTRHESPIRSNAERCLDTPVEPAPPNSRPPDLPAAEKSRKRKPPSDLSLPSGPNRYRTKSMVVVYYDSAIQEGFETLVKHVANARNMLRKGRTTATFQSRMASMGLPAENISSPPAKGLSAGIDLSLIQGSSTRPRAAVAEGAWASTTSDKDKHKVFDEADRDLEEAQNLAEKGAHQFLRDGDPRIEIGGMRKRFQAVESLGKKEVAKLNTGKHEDWPRTAETGSAAGSATGKVTPSLVLDPLLDTVNTDPSSNLSQSQFDDQTLPTTLSSPVGASKDIDNPPLLSTQPPPLASTAEDISTEPDLSSAKNQFNFAATGMIEVDDAASDASEVKIDMNAIRRVARRT